MGFVGINIEAFCLCRAEFSTDLGFFGFHPGWNIRFAVKIQFAVFFVALFFVPLLLCVNFGSARNGFAACDIRCSGRYCIGLILCQPATGFQLVGVCQNNCRRHSQNNAGGRCDFQKRQPLRPFFTHRFGYFYVRNLVQRVIEVFIHNRRPP